MIRLGRAKGPLGVTGKFQMMEMKMKTLIAALALLSFAAGPVFAQTVIQTPHPGYYGVSPNSPGLTGGGSFGHNRLQQDLGN